MCVTICSQIHIDEWWTRFNWENLHDSMTKSKLYHKLIILLINIFIMCTSLVWQFVIPHPLNKSPLSCHENTAWNTLESLVLEPKICIQPNIKHWTILYIIDLREGQIFPFSNVMQCCCYCCFCYCFALLSTTSIYIL